MKQKPVLMLSVLTTEGVAVSGGVIKMGNGLMEESTDIEDPR